MKTCYSRPVPAPGRSFSRRPWPAAGGSSPRPLGLLWLCLSLFLFLSGGALRATQVDWNGLAFSTNLTSTGQAWGDTWVAELGAFQSGFTPTAANTADWAANWNAASRSVYSASTGYFGASYIYATNPPQFPAGGRAYLWIFAPDAPQGQWILLTSSSWTWPVGVEFDFPVFWDTSQATQAIVGQLAAPGWDLKSAAVANSPLPRLSFDDWRKLYFTTAELADAAVSGPNADADGDGSSNLREYASGTQPRRAVSVPGAAEVFLTTSGGQTYAAARLTRSSRVLGYTWRAEVADDLINWTTNVTGITDLPWEWTVRRVVTVTAQPRGFFRFSLVP